MNPKPFLELNHLTLPVCVEKYMVVVADCWLPRRALCPCTNNEEDPDTAAAAARGPPASAPEREAADRKKEDSMIYSVEVVDLS
jgi:hypothetical protein